MPEYSFKCNDCGTRKTEFVRTVTDLEIPVCLNCNNRMSRDFRADLPNTSKDSYDRPIHSDALAINPSQRKEHERLYPDIKLDKKCRPIFDKFGSHEAYLKAEGFVKNPGKTKRKSNVII